MRGGMGETLQVRRRTGLGPLSNALRIGIGHDNPEVTPAGELRYDACLTVDDQVQATAEIGGRKIPGGQYAIVTHRGPYSNLTAGGGFSEIGCLTAGENCDPLRFRNLCQRSDVNATRGIGYADSRSLEKLIGVVISAGLHAKLSGVGVGWTT